MATLNLNPLSRNFLQPASTGRTYPTNFTGPIRPEDRRAPQNFIGPTYNPQPKQPTPTPQVLGINTGNNTGGSTSGQGNNQDFSNLIETPPPQPSFEDLYGSVFDTALQTLDENINQRQQGTEEDISLLQNQQQGAKSTIQGQLEAANKQLAGQAEQQQGLTREAQNQLRQQYAETAQGIQSRYGGTTGTGAFAEGIMGRAVQQQFAANQRNLQATLQDINNAKSQAYQQANEKLINVDLQTQSLIQQAKNQLSQDISSINAQKAQLGIQRQQRIAEAVSSYQSLVSEINARNTAFKQKMFSDQVKFNNELAQKQLNIQNNYSTDLYSAVENIFKKGGFNPNAYGFVENTLGFPQGSLGQTTGGGQLTTSKDNQEKEKLKRVISGYTPTQ